MEIKYEAWKEILLPKEGQVWPDVIPKEKEVKQVDKFTIYLSDGPQRAILFDPMLSLNDVLTKFCVCRNLEITSITPWTIGPYYQHHSGHFSLNSDDVNESLKKGETVLSLSMMIKDIPHYAVFLEMPQEKDPLVSTVVITTDKLDQDKSELKKSAPNFGLKFRKEPEKTKRKKKKKNGL
eukprot:TRINITY_DN8853_c0_g1_i5.p2 TRINITY_DN8853_c0_g1~~TRINITY_DN8853_c0_g1_i5.p2  ORF type:complete len:180 (-),score=40.18 TRINITY_DN8853_c0_g1_i5:1156-1695(-)